MAKDMVRLTVDMSPELANKIEELAERSDSSEGDILRKAIFLMHVAIDSQSKGNQLAVVNNKGLKVGDIIL